MEWTFVLNVGAALGMGVAMGALSGGGVPLHALFGTGIVLAVHLGLRPVARWIDGRTHLATDVETVYHFRVTCEERDEGLIRTILARHVNSLPRMMIRGIS